MTETHPLTPPDELLEHWQQVGKSGNWRNALTLAYRAGADQELEACCAEVSWQEGKALAVKLRERRRPKPPSLKEQALAAQQRMWDGTSNHDDWNLVRRALEALDD